MQSGRLPPLTWRRPAPLWALLSLMLALGPFALVLMGEEGFAQFALFTAIAGALVALITLGAAHLTGRAFRSRREVVNLSLWSIAATSLAAPFAFQALLMALKAANGGAVDTGLSLALPMALAPLALSMSLPMGIYAGLILAYVALTPARAEGPLTLTYETDPRLAADPIPAVRAEGLF